MAPDLSPALEITSLACSEQIPMQFNDVQSFAIRYTAAWNSQDPSRVADHFAEGGSLTINGGEPSIGREAITLAAEGFMTAFPDMTVTMDEVCIDGERAIYRWTLTGTNTGPGGTGNSVDISGYEEWTLDSEGWILESRGNFDETEYERQLQEGAPARS